MGLNTDTFGEFSREDEAEAVRRIAAKKFPGCHDGIGGHLYPADIIYAADNNVADCFDQ